MSAAFDVRRMVPHDAEGASELLAQLGYPTTASDLEARIRGASAANVEAVVAENADGLLLGLASMHRLPLLTADSPLALLTSVVVEQQARGLGVGRRMVEHLCARALELGCERIAVMTHLRRSDAHSFYERLGFQFTGRRYVRVLAAP
ncbi:GNAT family N-acetyltransferase [soil metagenome]